MRTRQGYALQALRGIQAFLDAHATTLGAIATCGARRRLDEQVAGLNIHAETQSGCNLAALGATQRLHALRFALLHDHMTPIARIARADLPRVPELAPLRMPRGRLSTELLFTAAVGMAEAAETHATVFVEAGLPADFLTQLREAAGAMHAVVDARAQSRGARRGATHGLAEVVSGALKTVRVLDAFVRRAVRHDPALLEAWNTVKRPSVKASKAATRVPVLLQAA